MALFKRNKSTSDDTPDEVDDVIATAETEGDDTEDFGADEEAPAGDDSAVTRREGGPYDVGQVEERGNRVDLGAIWLPTVPGMELRMEVDGRTNRITGVACTIGNSGLQIQAFAAPRTAGIWDEIRAEIAASVSGQGGDVDDLPGPFGRELLAKLPVAMQDGRKGLRPVRFIGVDGSRWFLRGVITGKAAIDPEQAAQIEDLFANIVVVRDEGPRPPRDLLAMHLPGQEAPLQTNQVAGQTPSFDPLTRGPEITEIR